jgi:hypothetical protein
VIRGYLSDTGHVTYFVDPGVSGAIRGSRPATGAGRRVHPERQRDPDRRQGRRRWPELGVDHKPYAITLSSSHNGLQPGRYLSMPWATSYHARPMAKSTRAQLFRLIMRTPGNLP